MQHKGTQPRRWKVGSTVVVLRGVQAGRVGEIICIQPASRRAGDSASPFPICVAFADGHNPAEFSFTADNLAPSEPGAPGWKKRGQQ